MADSRETKPLSPDEARRAEATRRRAAALRENLKRRKAQTRERQAARADEGSDGADAQDA